MAAGRALGERAEAGDVVLLEGPLGAGKTTFVKGLARGLGVDEGAVLSPTFVYVREVRGGRLPLYHVDAYRLASGDVPVDAISLMEELGLDHYLASGGVTVVEWPQPLLDVLPPERFAVGIRYEGRRGEGEPPRRLRIEAAGERPVRVLQALAAQHGWRRCVQR